jgi:hypothetical protein
MVFRYRMAVEEEDMKDRDTWASVARFWYCKAGDKNPNVGRLYHHLAILARSHPLQQLYLYSRSLTSVQPFQCARESIQTLLKPTLDNQTLNIPENDLLFIRCHACLYYENYTGFQENSAKFKSQLDPQISRITGKWREFGVYIASTNIGALFDLGQRNHITQLFEAGNFLSRHTFSFNDDPELQKEWNKLIEPLEMSSNAQKVFALAVDLFFDTLVIVLRRLYERNCQPFLHTSFAFLHTLYTFRRFDSHLPEQSRSIIRLFLDRTPWQNIAECCNSIMKIGAFEARFETSEFLRAEKEGENVCLPEDWLLRGMIWTSEYFPSDWFASNKTDEERSNELPSTAQMRGERIMHLAYKLAKDNDDYLFYSSKKQIWRAEALDDTLNDPLNDPDMVMVYKEDTMDEMELDSEPSANTNLYVLDPTLVDSQETLVSTLIGSSTTPVSSSCALPESVVGKLRLESQSLSRPKSNKAQSVLRILEEFIQRKKLKIFNTAGEDVSTEYEFPSSNQYAVVDKTASFSDIGPEHVLDTAKAAGRQSGSDVVLITNNLGMQTLAEQSSIPWKNTKTDNIRERSDQPPTQYVP